MISFSYSVKISFVVSGSTNGSKVLSFKIVESEFVMSWALAERLKLNNTAKHKIIDNVFLIFDTPSKFENFLRFT